MVSAISTGPLSPVEGARETARDDGIRVPQVADVCVWDAADEKHRRKWLDENAAQFAAQSEWHERHGHPLLDIIVSPIAASWK